NHRDILIVVDSEDYPGVLEFLKANQDDISIVENLLGRLSNISLLMMLQFPSGYGSRPMELSTTPSYTLPSKSKNFPPSRTVPLSLKSSLRYGENPHQKAAFYVDMSLAEVNSCGIATAIQHHGKTILCRPVHRSLFVVEPEMSHNNYLDADASWNCVSEFKNPTLTVRADLVSAFGGIVAFNIEVDEALAKEIREFRSPTDGETRMFYEIVIAPKYTTKGLEILRGKSKTLRILEASKNKKGKLSLRQDPDDLTPEDTQFNVVSEKTPQESERGDAEFAWLCVKHVKSNAIVIAKNNCKLGMGSGPPNRSESPRIAMKKAGDEVKGAALASDAFFPFAWKDAVEEACESGVSVIAEPSGSIRDKDAIDCCNKYEVSLLFTDMVIDKNLNLIQFAVRTILKVAWTT
ncbi:Bifunctional purine biosynthesis protein PurH-like, partial [Dillenia turbinata]